MAHRAVYKEAHAVPANVWHWINAICFGILIGTGFYIHYPLFGGWMGVFRGLHIAAGLIASFAMVIRIFGSFFMKSAPVEGTRETDTEIKNWLPQEANKHQMMQFVKYYLFMRKTHPIGAKINPLQKISYWLIPFLMLIMAYTGCCMWSVTGTWGIFAAGTAAMHGIMNVRIVHYCVMFLFILFIFIHVYLSLFEGSGLVANMFLRKEHPGYVCDPKTGEIIGFDDLSDTPEYKAKLAKKQKQAAKRAAKEMES